MENDLPDSVQSNIYSGNDTGLLLEEFINHAPIAVIRLDGSGHIVEYNNAFDILTRQHFVNSPIIGTIFYDLIIDEQEKEEFKSKLNKLVKYFEYGTPSTLELRLPDNSSLIVMLYANLIHCPKHNQPILVLHLIDQTEQKNLELRFAHSQKMQAVGQLAGGVAHDFNNLLTAMIGFCDLLLMRHPAGDPSFADIMQIKQNANRAANLVRQLLAFSRKQTLQPKKIDLSDLLAELSNLIRRLIGENIEFNMVHGRNIGLVKADQGQLEQVIINLAVNARDAMKQGGMLTIRTSDVEITPTQKIDSALIPPSEDEHITPGEYILVEIEDTGTGIPHDVIHNIFEPFFSTKEVGSGTGLGLATVYGIIKQTGGYIYVKSTAGEGTTFYLYLRRFQEEATIEEQPTEEAKPTDLTGKATILLVEDETPVRTFASRALSNKGYNVVEAENGEHALEVYEKHMDDIDIIISDVVMPGMNGPKMIETLTQRYNDQLSKTKIIFISGYAEDAFIDSFGNEREFNFLPKPFTLKQLASKVKEVSNG